MAIHPADNQKNSAIPSITSQTNNTKFLYTQNAASSIEGKASSKNCLETFLESLASCVACLIKWLWSWCPSDNTADQATSTRATLSSIRPQYRVGTGWLSQEKMNQLIDQLLVACLAEFPELATFLQCYDYDAVVDYELKFPTGYRHGSDCVRIEHGKIQNHSQDSPLVPLASHELEDEKGKRWTDCTLKIIIAVPTKQGWTFYRTIMERKEESIEEHYVTKKLPFSNLNEAANFVRNQYLTQQGFETFCVKLGLPAVW